MVGQNRDRARGCSPQAVLALPPAARALHYRLIMSNDISKDLRESTARKGAPPIEPQPLPAQGAAAARARDAIRPLADATYDRIVASGDIRTSNSPLYVGVRLK